VCGVFLNAVSIVQVIANEPQLLYWILNAQGSLVKEAAGSEGTLILTGTLSMGLFWWGIWRAPEVTWTGIWKFLKPLAFTASAIGITLSAVLKLGRGEIMPFIAGTAILFVVRQARRGLMTTRKLIAAGATTALLTIAIFAGASMLRGAENAEDDVAQVARYTLASYNRQAALLSGRLVYPTEGTGVYLSTFVSSNRSFNALFPIQTLMRWPSSYDVWSGEFEAVARAGLNRELIWSGAFGYIFSDLGWAAPGFMVLYGAFVGFVWRSISLGRTMGIILYPWCAFSILFWLGNNQIFDTKCAILLLAAMGISVYERVVGKRHLSALGLPPAFRRKGYA
jgi:hypothetical protein